MVGDEPVDFAGCFAREFQTIEDFFGEVGADFGVVVVADAFLVLGEGLEFADVVKEGGPFEGEGWGVFGQWIAGRFFVGEGV